ncbi:RNA methyltransferase [Legionella sp. W05-934-2]|jgi:tRNA (cytidine32/uridine32-2'-O)-methyltransferase|uniref:RNA methyltransferase n=1 Tax=Legionella sp. W05-934-2 TaxID=1198649 RepID=UPI00346261FA
MKLSQIRIVLVATTHPGNIGSTARAMKTMGLSQLYLVSPKHFPHSQANELASGADDILQQATVVESLSEALSGCHWVLATSARPRDLDLPGLLPAQAGQFSAEQDDSCQIAVVFGREHAGLTNEELLHAHFHIQIPANPAYASLNLAMAVQIICYEMRQAILSPSAITHTQVEEKASAEEVEGLYEHLLETMIRVQFLHPNSPGKLPQRIRRLLNRFSLERREVNLLRGFLTETNKNLENTPKN